MNDTELNELLNSWKTPPVPPLLRERVLAAIPAEETVRPKKLFPHWRFIVAGTAVAAVVFLLANTSAFPERVSPPPYTVDSEIVLWPGARECANCWKYVAYPAYPGPKTARMTSYNRAGSEVVLSWSSPDHPFEGAVWTARLAWSNVLGRVMRVFLLTADERAERELRGVVNPRVGETLDVGERAVLLNSGCRPSARQGEVVGEETILNYPTVVARYDFWKARMFLWMAPELSCFALRVKTEAQQADGSWTLVSEKKALQVTVNR
jgi:hypothetical protein